MRSYRPEVLGHLEDPATLTRLRPFLQDLFDPISLQRPNFLAEVGLLPEDEVWLRGGAYWQSWSSTTLVARAFSDEALSQKLTGQEWLERVKGLVGEALWRQAERILLRCQRMLFSPEASRMAKQLSLSLTDFERLRTRWRNEMEHQDQDFLDGLMLQLRGVGARSEWLATQMQAQRFERFWWFFRRQRPILTSVDNAEIELSVALELAGQSYGVASSFAQEVKENSDLSPELWARQWVDYLGKRSKLSNQEFRALLAHFADKERFRWPNLVALSGAKARRAVAAVAFRALEKLESAEDTASLEKLWQMVPDFSERYELQQVLKKRFGLGL
jgi:hypothetical protein